MNKKIIGREAELFVGRTLEDQGYTICAYNYQKTFGEVDIIARKDKALLFVEVKCRTNPLFDVHTIITRSKQKKIIAVAKYFMMANNCDDCSVQFDVAFVTPEGNHFISEYIPNAFNE